MSTDQLDLNRLIKMCVCVHIQHIYVQNVLLDYTKVKKPDVAYQMESNEEEQLQFGTEPNCL